ncbi:MAG: hypothetical protein AAB874_05275 [Patescibacteria group bacterium]
MTLTPQELELSSELPPEGSLLRITKTITNAAEGQSGHQIQVPENCFLLMINRKSGWKNFSFCHLYFQEERNLLVKTKDNIIRKGFQGILLPMIGVGIPHQDILFCTEVFGKEKFSIYYIFDTNGYDVTVESSTHSSDSPVFVLK